MDKIHLADQYFLAVRNRNLDDLCALYVADAVLAVPDGQEFCGVDAIRAMYRGLFAAQAPSPNPVHVIVGENSIAAELEIHLPNGEIRRTANFFRINDAGFITRLTVYARK